MDFECIHGNKYLEIVPLILVYNKTFYIICELCSISTLIASIYHCFWVLHKTLRVNIANAFVNGKKDSISTKRVKLHLLQFKNRFLLMYFFAIFVRFSCKNILGRLSKILCAKWILYISKYIHCYFDFHSYYSTMVNDSFFSQTFWGLLRLSNPLYRECRAFLLGLSKDRHT